MRVSISAGPRLLGLLFNWGLLGLLTTQVYVYFLNFPNDRRFMKALGTCILCILFSILLSLSSHDLHFVD